MTPRVYKKAGESVSAGDHIADVEIDGKPVSVKAQKDGVMQNLVYGKGGKIGNIPQGVPSTVNVARASRKAPLDDVMQREEKRRRQIISAKYKGPEVAQQTVGL